MPIGIVIRIGVPYPSSFAFSCTSTCDLRHSAAAFGVFGRATDPPFAGEDARACLPTETKEPLGTQPLF